MPKPTTSKPELVAHTVDELRLVDAADYRRARLDLPFSLIEILRQDKVGFLVPAKRVGWDRVAFLNLAYWTPGGGELLESRDVSVDELVHVAWHHLARRHLGDKGADAALLGEAIASASDAYLLGRLLRAAPQAAFLEAQVPRMAERAQDAGLDARGFEGLLERFAASPEAAFEALRQLLYDASLGVLGAKTVPDAAARLAPFDAHPFAPLLHHYELATWVLHVRAHAAPGRRKASGTPSRAARLDVALRATTSPLAELRRRWRVL